MYDLRNMYINTMYNLNFFPSKKMYNLNCAFVIIFHFIMYRHGFTHYQTLMVITKTIKTY